VEHQGVHPGFHSHLCLAPDDGVGVVVFTNGAQDPMFWLSTEAQDLLGAAIGVESTTRPDDLPLSVEATGELVGWYRLAGPWSNLRQRLFLGAGAEVFERDDRLTLRFLALIPDLYRGYPLSPDDPADADVWRVDLGEAGTSRVVVARDADGAVSGLHLGMMPITLQRQPAATNPRRWVKAALGLALATLAALVLAGLARARASAPPNR
jgi:hypothetical protein